MQNIPVKGLEVLADLAPQELVRIEELGEIATPDVRKDFEQKLETVIATLGTPKGDTNRGNAIQSLQDLTHEMEVRLKKADREEDESVQQKREESAAESHLSTSA